MANPYHHALSSVKKWGGEVDDYLAVHEWFDASKEHHGDFRHRALRHHSQGIYECARTFGTTLTLSTGRVIPTRWVAEQHVTEDMGRIPSLSEWLGCIAPEPWMKPPAEALAGTGRSEQVTYGSDKRMDRYNVFAALAKLGAAKAVVYFSGGNDEGGVDAIKLLDENDKEVQSLDVHGDWRVVDGQQQYVPPKDERLVSSLGGPVDDEYGSFAGEFSVSGTVVWDARAHTVQMKKSESVESWTDSEYDL